MASHLDELVFVPLGGLGEIGMNAALYGFGPEGVLVGRGRNVERDEPVAGDLCIGPEPHVRTGTVRRRSRC